jgi:hypothetical protein
VSDRESGPIEDDAPASPPIPSFASLRSSQRRSALDLFVPPAEQALPPPEQPPVSPEPEPKPEPEAEPASRPRPAEWGDLLLLGAHLTRCVTRGLRSLLRG